MDPRYSGRLSPPRRYAAPGRNSTGRLDTDYESYYQPRSSRDSLSSGPRASAERIVPRNDPRVSQASRTNRDDYYVAPRYPDGSQGSRRPPPILTPASSSSRYRPVISSAADLPSSPYSKSRGRDDESYYIQPASSGHSRHFSVGSSEIPRYASTREREKDKPIYRSSGPKNNEYLSPVMPVRDPRDRRDRDFGYEYTTPREQAYYDTAPRPRARRVSDLGSRERPISIGGIDDYRRQHGPPVTTRGLAKIDDDGYTRREYRYPRDEPSSRDTSQHRGSREERDRLKLPRGPVAVHQDDGYSSNIEERSRDKSHRHKHRDVDNRDKYADDDRRPEDSIKRHHRTDSEDRRTKHYHADPEEKHRRSHRHKDDSEDGRAPRDDRYEREDEDRDRDRDRRRRNDEPRKDRHEERKIAEGVALGAAGIGAAGALAEGLKQRHERDGSDIESDTKRERSRRHRHRDEVDSDRGIGSDEADEDRRERRRRRRKEREERELREREEVEGSSSWRDDEPRDRYGKPVIVPVADSRPKDGRMELYQDDGEDRASPRRSRRRRDRGSSSDTESADGAIRGDRLDQSRVRVVSPARDSSRKPKGILRQPTSKFPEDPAPIREGVAPLKDSGKKGIPPNARWTKIDRRLVNPEALDLGNERFEERPDSVIVLRVLTKDEIEKYATITQELRSRRAGNKSRDDEPRMIESGHNRDDSTDSDRPKQIAAQPHNEPTEPASPAIIETAGVVGDGDRDRPPLQKEISYQRFAPTGVQPQSSIPTYPSIPTRSSISGPQSQASSAPSVGHDPTYPGQGGGYKSSQS